MKYETAIMETIIIKTKDKSELAFFLELAKRLGVDAKTIDDVEDEMLLRAMENNKHTPTVDKSLVMDTIQNILNDR